MKLISKINILIITAIGFSSAYADSNLDKYEKAREGCANSVYCEEMSVASMHNFPVTYKITCKNINQKYVVAQFPDGESNFLVADTVDGQWTFVKTPGGPENAAWNKKYPTAQAAIDSYCEAIYE